MFYIESTDQYIQEGSSFTLNDITYVNTWLNTSTPEQKAALGIVDVITTNAPKNDRYYWVSQNLSGATLTYTNTPKDLDQVKKMCVNQINASAYSLLLPSDWRVIKAVETETPLDGAWKVWRASIRNTAANTVTLINAATDVDQVAEACNVSWPKDPTAEAN